MVCPASIYTGIPDIVATLEGLAPRGAGHEGLSLWCLADLESEWPIWRV